MATIRLEWVNDVERSMVILCLMDVPTLHNMDTSLLRITFFVPGESPHIFSIKKVKPV